MLPTIIQGGMGVGISTPALARAASLLGGLGTVSGVAVDKLMVRRLQRGDPGGDIQRALSHFPFPEIADEVLREYFVPGGIALDCSFKPLPMMLLEPTPLSVKLLVCANFAFVWLAKEGHTFPVSINWLEKMQMYLIYSIAGAMLAGVDVVSIGAGIPLQVPGVLDAFAHGQPAGYRVAVTGSGGGSFTMRFDPRQFFGPAWPESLNRPAFLPIVSSDVLAGVMTKKLKDVPDPIQGFVVELPVAGGHNAPPRGSLILDGSGEPVYSERDQPDFEKLVSLGVPFWIGGGMAAPTGLPRAWSVGAYGIQVGSIFALCEQSGLHPSLRKQVIRLWHRGELHVKQDPLASPTGYPFQVAQLPGTLSDESVYLDRDRICNHHSLSVPHRMPDGKIVYRCSAEPLGDYTRKGADKADATQARCLCDCLIANTGYGDPGESFMVTLGSDLSFLADLTNGEDGSYSLEQAMAYLKGPA